MSKILNRIPAFIAVALFAMVSATANASVTTYTFSQGDMEWSMQVGMVVNINNRAVLNSLSWTQEYETEALCNAAEAAINAKVAANHGSFNNDNPAAPWVGNSINKGSTVFTVCTRIRQSYE